MFAHNLTTFASTLRLVLWNAFQLTLTKLQNISQSSKNFYNQLQAQKTKKFHPNESQSSKKSTWLKIVHLNQSAQNLTKQQYENTISP